MATTMPCARRYARLLVSEIALYHEPAVVAGRRDARSREEARPEIARARHLYEERVPSHVRQRTDVFDAELVRTLADGDATLLAVHTSPSCRPRFLFIALLAARAAPHRQPAGARRGARRRPTTRACRPRLRSSGWCRPADRQTRSAAQAELAAAVKFEIDANYAKALPLLSQASAAAGAARRTTRSTTKGSPSCGSAAPADARRTFQALQSRERRSAIWPKAAALREAECDEALGDHAAARRDLRAPVDAPRRRRPTTC